MIDAIVSQQGLIEGLTERATRRIELDDGEVSLVEQPHEVTGWCRGAAGPLLHAEHVDLDGLTGPKAQGQLLA